MKIKKFKLDLSEGRKPKGYNRVVNEGNMPEDQGFEGEERPPQDEQAPVDAEERPATPVLDNFGIDLTKRAEEDKLDPVIGRHKEIIELSWILCRKNKNNPVLIGDAGVGKTAIVEGLAQLIVKGKCPSKLKGKKIMTLDIGSLLAGAKYRGQFEERVKAIVQELSANKEWANRVLGSKQGDIILFIDEVHMIVGAGGETDAANMLKPALARGELQCIGCTTLNEYRESIEKDNALERRFQKVMVEQTSLDDTLEILKRIKERYEDYHIVTYTDDALKACVSLADKHLQDRFFPDKAIDLLDEAGAKAHLEDANVPEEITSLEEDLEKMSAEKMLHLQAGRYDEAQAVRQKEVAADAKLKEMRGKWEEENNLKRVEITADSVAEIFSIKTGIPVEKFNEDEGAKLMKMGENLKMDIIGQDEAIAKISKCVKRNRAGLKDPKKPMGVFLFLGPTGVGKTQTVKSLAKHLFGSEDNMIRVDMSEYAESHNRSRMIGAPPGYVGYGEGGQLTEKVRRKPYSVVLLDEIEKAHPEVLTLFLQAFDDGIMTDGSGRKVSFKNTIMIMTSNIGTNVVKQARPMVGYVNAPAEQKEVEMKDQMKKELNKRLPAEFLNRIDDVIIFNSLGKENLFKIIDIEIGQLVKRIKELGYTLTLTEKAKEFLLEKGFDEKMGARPLKRAIQTYIEDPLADLMLSKKITDNINIDYDEAAKKLLINGEPVNESFNMLDTVKKFGEYKKLF
jgi:ATP-dependent Clp protease ATP-binding subunit ClpC